MKIQLISSITLVVLLVSNGCLSSDATSKTKTLSERDRWWETGANTVEQRIAATINKNKARNIILFIGDGMGISTITAARIFDGQGRGETGEENSLSFEQFPNVGLIKTYNTNAQVPDSAGTASAINTGVKTQIGRVSTWPDQGDSDCYGLHKDFPRTLAERAEARGLSTGIVTTDKVTYATPAAVYAHAPSRLWEDDSNMTKQDIERGCQDIAAQLINFPFGNGIDVIFGGGSESFLPASNGGKRRDGKNLVKAWNNMNPNGNYISNARELRNLKVAKTEKVLGLFAPHHLSFAVDKDIQKEPTLAEMTAAAIDILSNNKNGYFLMIENGHIDHAHHDNNAYRALSETQVLAEAVKTAVSKVNLENTLVLVTADHSHPLTIAGHPKRGNPITGLVKQVDIDWLGRTVDGYAVDLNNQHYTTLGYRTGKGHIQNPALSPQEKNYRQKVLIPLRKGLHGGEDVALFATGPQSHLFSGVMEQNAIFHLITHALDWEIKI